jgi:hypothetical protein
MMLLSSPFVEMPSRSISLEFSRHNEGWTLILCR